MTNSSTRSWRDQTWEKSWRTSGYMKAVVQTVFCGANGKNLTSHMYEHPSFAARPSPIAHGRPLQSSPTPEKYPRRVTIPVYCTVDT